jgi:hypothetical protein
VTDSATDTPTIAPREALSAIDRVGEQGTRMLETRERSPRHCLWLGAGGKRFGGA